MGTQGTGKHGHKDAKEPYSHHETSSTRGRKEQRQSGQESRSRQRETGDLRSQEHRDEQGNIRHHTRTSEAMKEKEPVKEEE
jgi:hypothetical protein